MQRKSFAVDYRQFRLSKLNDESFRHLKLLLFWPIYGFFFYFVEKLYMPARYYPMHCALDDMIPFCELFMIPYLAWFLCIVGMLLYTMLYDIGAFKRFMYFIILTYSVTIVIYLIFPTCQQLRPAAFPRDKPAHADGREFLRLRHQHQRLPVHPCARRAGRDVRRVGRRAAAEAAVAGRFRGDGAAHLPVDGVPQAAFGHRRAGGAAAGADRLRRLLPSAPPLRAAGHASGCGRRGRKPIQTYAEMTAGRGRAAPGCAASFGRPVGAETAGRTVVCALAYRKRIKQIQKAAP